MDNSNNNSTNNPFLPPNPSIGNPSPTSEPTQPYTPPQDQNTAWPPLNPTTITPGSDSWNINPTLPSTPVMPPTPSPAPPSGLEPNLNPIIPPVSTFDQTSSSTSTITNPQQDFPLPSTPQPATFQPSATQPNEELSGQFSQSYQPTAPVQPSFTPYPDVQQTQNQHQTQTVNPIPEPPPTTSPLENPWGPPTQSPIPSEQTYQNSPLQTSSASETLLPADITSPSSQTEPITPTPPWMPQQPQPVSPYQNMETSQIPQGGEPAPTDLSHLINNSIAENGQTVQNEPEILVAPVAGAAEIPSVPTSEGKKGIPKWLIGVGVGLLIIVAGASAYFILGIGQNQNPPSSIPATTTEQTQQVKPPAPIPTAVSQPTPSTTGSTNFGDLGGSGSQNSTQQATSAADLLRQRQGR